MTREQYTPVSHSLARWDNHLLDELVAALWFGIVGPAIDIPPLHLPLLFLFMPFVEVFARRHPVLEYAVRRG